MAAAAALGTLALVAFRYARELGPAPA
jgi:hypothetical protein